MIYTRSTNSNGKCKTYGGKILIFHVYPEGHEKVTIQNTSVFLFIIFCLLMSPMDKNQSIYGFLRSHFQIVTVS